MVVDRPKRLIKNLVRTDKGYNTAWEILNDAYNNKDRQGQELQQKIRELAPAKDELMSLCNVYEELGALLRALSIYKEIDNDDDLWKEVMAKYPVEILNRLTDHEIAMLPLLCKRIKPVSYTHLTLPTIYSV